GRTNRYAARRPAAGNVLGEDRRDVRRGRRQGNRHVSSRGLRKAFVPGLDDWLTVARSADPEDLREHILTGYKSGKPFTPYVPTLPLPPSIDSVLDFGFGVGRSFPYLKSIARHVVGYDLPPMIERCRALATEPVDLLSGDW